MEDKHLLLEICEAYKNGASFERICREFGGVSIYIPKVIPNAHERILSEFNGYNTATLAYKYNLSQNAVRQIIKDANADKTPSLFEDVE